MIPENKTHHFSNRKVAGELLAQKLIFLKDQQGIVLGIPRGGIPVAYEIAKTLAWPLGAIWIKKIGHPHNPELAIGAVSMDDIELNEYAENISRDYIDERVKQIRSAFIQQQQYFPKNSCNPLVYNKCVILVDDGIATGSTMLTAIRFIRHKKPSQIIVATPVAPNDALKKIEKIADEVVILHQPLNFTGISAFYDEFPQLSDDDAAAYFSK